MTQPNFAIGLVRPKTSANVGSALRAAGCYGASAVLIEGLRGSHGMVTRSATDTMKAYRHVPTLLCDDLMASHPVGMIPVIVELIDGAESLVDFQHPKRAFYVFGPEDGTLGVKHAREGLPRVYIPTTGCMNLAATVNVVLYDRLAKANRTKLKDIGQ